MRLLRTTAIDPECPIQHRAYQLEEFFDNNIPPYAILSHTWNQSGEPTFQDLLFLHGDLVYRSGNKKIDYAIAQAACDGRHYIWIDTICIDKSNSTELFEAINSMFRWYNQAEICYAYLEDVNALRDIPSSRWFTRGWTLQELLAPELVLFFSTNWKPLGSKTDRALRPLLLAATGIAKEQSRVLDSFKQDEWKVAERMSWASKRTTTRSEDIAYSLLGIFNVHIPLLYGEGDRAFIRLQEEIMRVSNDHSLFAWIDHEVVPQCPCGLLARSPAQFANWKTVASTQWSLSETMDDQSYEPFSLTNQGIHIDLTLIAVDPKEDGTYYAMLGYGSTIDRPAIIVRRLIRNEFARVNADKLVSFDQVQRTQQKLRTIQKGYSQTIIIRQRPPIFKNANPKSTPTFWIDTSNLAYAGISLTEVHPHQGWDPSKSLVQAAAPGEIPTLIFSGYNRWVGYVYIELTIAETGHVSLRCPGKHEHAHASQPAITSIYPQGSLWERSTGTRLMTKAQVGLISDENTMDQLWITARCYLEPTSMEISSAAQLTSEDHLQSGRFLTVLIQAERIGKPSIRNQLLDVFNIVLFSYTFWGSYGILHRLFSHINQHGGTLRSLLLQWLKKTVRRPSPLLTCLIWAYVNNRQHGYYWWREALKKLV